jgi:hypothetical protein
VTKKDEKISKYKDLTTRTVFLELKRKVTAVKIRATGTISKSTVNI